MENMADEQIRAARTLFNLAHCYLRTTEINDEQEDKYEEDEKNKTIKKDFQQTEKEEVNGKKDDTFDKQQEKQNELDDEIELYLQVQVESKYQQQLCEDIQNKDLKKEKPEIEIELKIEIPQEFDGSYLKNVHKEKHFEEEVEKKSKKKHEFNQKKERENIQELVYSEINPDSEFQHGTERKIRLKRNKSKDNVLADLSGKNVNSLNTQDQIQKGIKIKLQEKDNSDVLLEHELQEQKNLHQNLMESFHRSVQKRIERLIYKIPLEKQKINDDLRQEIKELNEEIKKLDPEHFNELNTEILEEVSKKDYLPVQVKFFKNLYRSFIQDSAPFYDRLDELSNDKTQTAVQQKLNEEFLKKLDSVLLQKCNKETQEAVNGNKRNQTYFEDIDRKEKYQHYDLVVQYNHEMSQELEGHAQQVLGKKVLVDFYDDAVKTYINKSVRDAIKEKLRKAGTDMIDQTQKEENKNIIFQLEFYKNVQVEEELKKKNEKQLQKNIGEEINGDLIVKTQKNELEVEEDSDVEIEDFEEQIQVYSEITYDENVEEVNENSKFKIEELERDIIVESGVKTEESEKEVQEDSDVDIEGFEGEIPEFPEVKIEDFEEESQKNTDSNTEDLSEEDFNDINEVVEIVEDIEVESNYSIDDYIPSNKISTSACNEINLKNDPNSNLTHDEEEKSKTINSSDTTIFTDHIKEKQTFFEFEHRLDELSQEYKGYVQQTVLKELEQEIDNKQLQDMEIFPDTLKEVNINIKEDFKKEIEELQSEWCQLKPEFMNNVPLSFEEKNSSKKLKEKPFNLFDKLHSIHRKLLCKFADSKEWPENCFHPSSLLDVLFDDPTEFKPNVLVVVLHSLDKGYSIKINTNKNSKSPEEYFFNYYEDTILVHMEDEHLPPDLLDLLDSAEPKLFYSGCVIAEIHDQVDEVPGRIYRLILRPFSLSIQRDIDRIIAKNSHATDINYWSYNKRLKLESILLKKSYPVMCMDSSPIAGLVVNLQHQVLSCRTIVLNPLKRKNNCLKPKPSKIDSFNESNDNLNTSMLSNELHEGSSKLMDTESTNIENYVLWKFEFRIKLLKLFKMFVLYITETQEFSIILCTNPKIDSIKRIRFKIQPLEKKLHVYINKMRAILREKISPDIEVFQRYKCQSNSAPLSFKSIPSLLNDKLYKANDADISQLMNIFISNSNIKYLPINKKLEDMYAHNSGITKLETEKSDLSLVQEKLTADSQKTNETKENSGDPEIKRSMLFSGTKKLSTSSKKFLDVLNVDLVDKIPDSSTLKTLTIPKDLLLNEDTSLEPSFILDLSKMDLKDKVADLSSLKPQTMSKNILINEDTMPSLKEKLTNIETNYCLEALLIKPTNVVSEYDNSSDLVEEKILSVSSGSMIPVFRFPTTTRPFESSPAVVLSSLSIVNSLVTSIKTYMLPIESPSLGYIAKSESWFLQTDENVSTSRSNDDDDSNIKPSPPGDLIHLTKIDNIAVNMFYYINQITPPTSNEMSQTENIFTMFSNSECVENREILEDEYMLRCLQVFHQEPTVPDISTPNYTQKNGDEFPDNIRDVI